MANVNVQGLIDEVLNMLRTRQQGGDTSGGSWYGGNKDEEEYWKEIRRRNTELERQGLANTGAANVEGIRSTGELARQRLIGESAKTVADIGLEGHKYTADATVKGHEITGKALTDVAGINLGQANKDPMTAALHAAIAKDPDLISDPKRWPLAIENARMLNKTAPGAENIRAFHTPSPGPSLNPTTSPVSAPAIVSPSPVRSTLGQVDSPSSGEGVYTNPLTNRPPPVAPTDTMWGGVKKVGRALLSPFTSFTDALSPDLEAIKKKKRFGEM